MSKKEKNSNSCIKCNVETCKYNNCDENCCELDEIKVGCTCAKDDCCSKEETICDSFKEDKDKVKTNEKEVITDTEYEVEAEDEDYEEEEA